MNVQKAPVEETTEGHRFSSSDRSIKHDVQDVVSEERADGGSETEGHRFYNSDRTIKHDVRPVESERGDEDVEGHGVRVRF